jgi:hypothetical protein
MPDTPRGTTLQEEVMPDHPVDSYWTLGEALELEKLDEIEHLSDPDIVDKIGPSSI